MQTAQPTPDLVSIGRSTITTYRLASVTHVSDNYRKEKTLLLLKHRLRFATALGLIGMAFATAAPAAAVSTCDNTSNVTFQAAQTLNLFPVQPGASNLFRGNMTVTALCSGAPLSGVSISVKASRTPNAPADLEADVNGAAKQSLPLCDPASLPMCPAATLATGLLTDANGNASFTLEADSATVWDLATLAQPIGLQFELTTSVNTSTGLQSVTRMLTGDIRATPELDSIALFGSGALGMAGYALLRLRAGRRRDA